MNLTGYKTIRVADFVDSIEGAKILTANSGRPISPSYLTRLAKYGTIDYIKIGRASLYSRKQVEAYVVEKQGVKVSQLMKKRAQERIAGGFVPKQPPRKDRMTPEEREQWDREHPPRRQQQQQKKIPESQEPEQQALIAAAS